jgi:CDP-4-dehydro-6-deoxyglucose reductase, E1
MNWKLNESNFTFLDRLKICSFFLNEKNFWTMSDRVQAYELAMADWVGSKYAVFVSSGSTANTLLAMYLKDTTPSYKKIVVLPSTTWITSVSPFIREGFEPYFIDINIQDLSIDLDKVEEYLKDNSDQVACVFITSLLGFVPDVDRIKLIESKYNVKIMFDNCENTFGTYKGKNTSSFLTSTTSTYFGHQLQSVEGGFIFTNDQQEWEYYLMARNHGMVRSITGNKTKYSNTNVDSRFDFYLFGNNFRNTNINALIGLLDLNRASQYINTRQYMYSLLNAQLTSKFVTLPKMRLLREGSNYNDVPFCIPLIFTDKKYLNATKEFCEVNKIETRPIISGNLLRQTCLKNFADPLDYPTSEYLHNHGMYIGLHNKITKNHITKLVTFLNQLN